MFGKPRLVEKNTEAWIFDRLAWVLEVLGTEKPTYQTQLALPNNEFFPIRKDDDDAVEQIFRLVTRYAGVENWSFELTPLAENGAKPIGEALLLQPLTQPQPIENNDNGSEALPVQFPARYRDAPSHLVSCFALEIALHLLSYREFPDEFSDDEIGALADLVTVYLGFGIFRVNTAFGSESSSDFNSHAWGTERQGVLTETSLVFTTAIFVRLVGIAPEDVRPFLKNRLRKSFDKAIRQVDASPDEIAHLRSCEPPNLTLVE